MSETYGKLSSVRKTTPPVKRVAVALKLSFSSHRDILAGISRYAKDNRWMLRLLTVPETFNVETLRKIETERFDGFITCTVVECGVSEFFERTTVPTVVIGLQGKDILRRKQNIAFVHCDESAIGRCGAEFLTSKGRCRSYGFLPSCEMKYNSLLRMRGFQLALENRHLPCFVYVPAKPGAEDGSEEDIEALADWLEQLPKPAAVMAVYDLRATHLLEAARRRRINVPGSVSVIGVDNDPLLCNFSTPTLSSIAPDGEKMGLLTTKTLKKLMSSHGLINVKIDVKSVVERESTPSIAPLSRIVDSALDYIKTNAVSGISTRDVALHLGISRRLMDLRFKQATGLSILEKILQTRLEAVKDMLEHTALPIGKVSAACGFRSENYAKNLFRKRFGLSMRDFRNGKGSSPIFP